MRQNIDQHSSPLDGLGQDRKETARIPLVERIPSGFDPPRRESSPASQRSYFRHRMSMVRTTVSLPETVMDSGKERAAGWRMSFSEYVARLIEEDVASGRTEIVLVRAAEPQKNAAPAPKKGTKKAPPAKGK
ncbi:MAG: hypothetical protein V4710_15570 [Verrucomicrobiota bacterium]